jgi:hypothetical protein
MVKIRALVPLQHPKTQELFAAGTEVDVADEVAADWKADGKITYIDDEKAAEKAAQEGNYSARMTRDKAGGADATEEPPKREKK